MKYAHTLSIFEKKKGEKIEKSKASRIMFHMSWSFELVCGPHQQAMHEIPNSLGKK